MISLQLKPEQQQIVESAEAFLTKGSPMNLVRATANTSVEMDTHLWSEIANLGWCGVHLPEEVSGLNLDWVSLCLLQEQAVAAMSLRGEYSVTTATVEGWQISGT